MQPWVAQFMFAKFPLVHSELQNLPTPKSSSLQSKKSAPLQARCPHLLLGPRKCAEKVRRGRGKPRRKKAQRRAAMNLTTTCVPFAHHAHCHPTRNCQGQGTSFTFSGPVSRALLLSPVQRVLIMARRANAQVFSPPPLRPGTSRSRVPHGDSLRATAPRPPLSTT